MVTTENTAEIRRFPKPSRRRVNFEQRKLDELRLKSADFLDDPITDTEIPEDAKEDAWNTLALPILPHKSTLETLSKALGGLGHTISPAAYPNLPRPDLSKTILNTFPDIKRDMPDFINDLWMFVSKYQTVSFEWPRTDGRRDIWRAFLIQRFGAPYDLLQGNNKLRPNVICGCVTGVISTFILNCQDPALARSLKEIYDQTFPALASSHYSDLSLPEKLEAVKRADKAVLETFEAVGLLPRQQRSIA